MSAYAQKQASNSDSSSTEFGPGERPLYFNNHGLFSDPFLAHHLPAIEKKDARDASGRYLNEYWNESTYEGYNDFNHVYAQMLSMWDQYGELLPDYNEAQLEERWIKPIFKLLGWTYEVQDSKTRQAKRNVPDYSLFSDEKDYIKAKKAKTDEAYFDHVLAVADAKAWKLALDGLGRTNNNPSYQIVRYMEHAGCQWGILTNGRFWRLYSTRSTSRHTTFYEIDLESLLVKRNDSRFKYFYNFFRRDAFTKSTASEQCFLDVVFENGIYYAKDVEANLKQRVFEVVENIAKGFVGSEGKLPEEDLREVYHHSLYYLFRLMFVLNCESKGLLAVDKTSDYFEYSLRKLVTGLKAQYDGNHNWSSQSRTYALVNDLFELLSKGDSRIGVHGFGQEVFASGKKAFFDRHKIPDHHLNEALVQLACDYSDDGEELQFIDYKRLSEDHLGSLFEGLLEYELVYAECRKVVSKTGQVTDWSPETRKSEKFAIIEKGSLYLSAGSDERKATGSYYTPQYIVDTIVDATLHDSCENKSPNELLKLRICDPAMGSGHFLLGAVKYLEEKIQEFVYKHETEIEFDMEAIRWQLLANCIYGVDLNPLAVELSKFSLWMYTARRGYKLEPLADQFMAGDSLVKDLRGYQRNFDWDEKIFAPKGFKGFDAVIGNPPYKVEYNETYKTYLTAHYPTFSLPQNVYSCFIEKAIHLIRREGGAAFGFIIPNTFISGKTYIELRRSLDEAPQSITVADLGDSKVFANANVYTAIVIGGSKRGKKTVNLTRLSNVEQRLSWRSLEFAAASGSVEEGWRIASGFEDFLQGLPTIGDLCEVKDVGFNYWSQGRGKTRGGSIADRVLYEGKRRNKNDVPYAKGRDFGKFSFTFANRYLVHDWEDQLVEGDTFRFSQEYFDLDDRIVYRQTSSEIIATLLPSGMGNDKTVHIIAPKSASVSKLLLLGFLNSSLCTKRACPGCR